MKQAYRLYKRRNGYYYIQNNSTREQKSLETKSKAEAQRLFEASNHGTQAAALNLKLGSAYLTHADPKMSSRTWQEAMDELKARGCESSKIRYERAMRAKEFDLIRDRPFIQTSPEDLRAVLKRGGNATNNFLRRLHNIALENGWIPAQIIPARKWEKVTKKPKRGVTQEEQTRILGAEVHSERRHYYEMLWLVGATCASPAPITSGTPTGQKTERHFQSHPNDGAVLLHAHSLCYAPRHAVHV